MNETGVALPPLGEDKYASLEEEARCDLARKLAGLLPTLNEATQRELQHYIFGTLRMIARDQTARVRRLLAEELKCSPNAPPEVIRALAWDKDLSVSLPVIEFSPLLDEATLLDLIATSGISNVLEAIARRHELPGQVSEAIVETGNSHAIGYLLANRTADLTDKTLESALELAPQQPSWHSLLVQRPELTLRTINRIAGFVSSALIEELQKKHLLPEATGTSLAAAASLRLKHVKIDREMEAEMLAGELFTSKHLLPDHVMQAVHEDDREFAIIALALLSGIGRESVERILRVRNARAATALGWKAGLTMRDTIKLQLKLAHIPHTEIMQAHDGVDYPLSAEEMTEYLGMFED